MKIQIDHLTPIPTVAIIGCEQSFGCEELEICFDVEWKNLKKHVTFYLSEDDSEPIEIEYKRSPIAIPDKALKKAGIVRYVIKGESRRKRIVCKTGFLRVLKAPDELPEKEAVPSARKRRAE